MLALQPILTPPTDVSVAVARTLPDAQQRELRKLWIHAVNADTRCIGWLPTQAWDTRHAEGNTYTVHRNDDLVGWAMATVSKARGVMKVYQIWVRPDARILEHGRALISLIAKHAKDGNCWRIEAWVAEDIDANFFWPQVGFTRTVWRHGRGTDPRKIFLWIAPVTTPHYLDQQGGKTTTT